MHVFVRLKRGPQLSDVTLSTSSTDAQTQWRSGQRNGRMA